MIVNTVTCLFPLLVTRIRVIHSGSIILLGYGMTECMQITLLPADLSCPSINGVTVVPKLITLDSFRHALSVGLATNIYFRRPPVIIGHECNVLVKEEPLLPGDWFNTGDLGNLNHGGYLYITSCSKDVTNLWAASPGQHVTG